MLAQILALEEWGLPSYILNSPSDLRLTPRGPLGRKGERGRDKGKRKELKGRQWEKKEKIRKEGRRGQKGRNWGKERTYLK